MDTGSREALDRRQHRKLFPCPPQVERVFVGGLADHALDPRGRRAVATEGDHLKAADLSNLAARKGVALSTPDALIAAQAFNRRASLFTADADFPRSGTRS